MWNPFPLASSSPSPPPSLKPLKKFILSLVSPQTNSNPLSLPQLSKSFWTNILLIAQWPSSRIDGDNVIKIICRLEARGNNAVWNKSFAIWYQSNKFTGFFLFVCLILWHRKQIMVLPTKFPSIRTLNKRDFSKITSSRHPEKLLGDPELLKIELTRWR